MEQDQEVTVRTGDDPKQQTYMCTDQTRVVQ